MSTAPTDSATAEETYIAKLDIGLATPKRFKRLVELYAENPRVVITGVGVSGVGKSQGIKQVARERGVPFPSEDTIEDLTCASQIIHVPQMQVEDFYIPTTPSDKNDKRYYDRRIPRRFEPVLSYVEKYKEEIIAGTKGRPILLVEEPNRARDRAVTAALFTLLEDRMIGDTHVSPLVQMVCLMNPSGGNNAVNQFEKDNASRRRLLFVGITSSFGEFLDHAEESGFHEEVINFIKAQPLMVYDHAAAAAGHVFACPASWETVSDILKTVARKELSLTCMDSRLAIAGKIGATATSALFDYIENKATILDPQDVLTNYAHNSSIRARVLNYTTGGAFGGKPRHDLIATLCQGLAKTIFRERKEPTSYAHSLPLFMDDLMPDMLVAFITQHMAGEAKNHEFGEGGMKYWGEMGQKFSTVPAYTSAMAKLNHSLEAAKQEAAAEAPSPDAN